MGSSVDDALEYMFGTLKEFERIRWTGQVQFQVNMNQGGVSQPQVLTKFPMPQKQRSEESRPTTKERE